MRKKGVFFLFLISALIFTSCGTAFNRNEAVERYDMYMGTIITVKAYGKNADKAADKVINRISELERIFTINDTSGEIDALNGMAGIGEVQLTNDSIYVLNKAIEYAKLSEGTFDVTIGPLVKAWGIGTDNHRVPSKDEIDELLKLVNFRDLRVDNTKLTASLAHKGQIVDLGGIAKGYAGDEAIGVLKENGIKSALVNLGGNVVVLGSKPDGSPWTVGIQNPRATAGKYLGTVSVRDKAVVSSGDYERFFMKDGIRYHHILDPRTGYPADSGLISTTIIADSAIDADALSTSVFILGLDKGMQLVESLDGVDAIFVTEDKKVYVTEGLKDIFVFYHEDSKDFDYVEKR